MDNQQRLTLSYLKDMFNGTFEENVIESVLEQRNWNSDRAIDDLMILAEGCTFELPVTNDDTESVEKTLQAQEEIQEKTESEDDVIVLNEEEFCLSNASESGSEEDEEKKEEKDEPPKLSYACIAKKNPPTYQEITNFKPPPIVLTGYTTFDRIKRTRDSLERIKLFVRQGFKIMVILRGCPGSGKTSLAKRILNECNIEKNYYWYVHSTDDYFHLNEKGEYQHDPLKLDVAHKWNQINVLHVVRENLTPVIIDNTNTKMWEMEAYAAMAVCAGYEIEIVEPDNPWAFHCTELAKRNIHKIERNRIAAFLAHYEYNISSSMLLKSCNLDYTEGNNPPQTGVLELSDKELISLFEDLYKAIHVYPKQIKLLKKEQKPNRKERRRLRKMEDKAIDELVDQIEGCDKEDAVSVESSEVDEAIALSAETSESEKSWEDTESESADESKDSSDESEDSESDSSEYSSSQNEADPETSDLDEDDGNSDTVETTAESKNNSMNLGADEVSAEVNSVTKHTYHNQLYQALSTSGHRLQCFENMPHDQLEGKMNHNDGEKNVLEEPPAPKFEIGDWNPMEKNILEVPLVPEFEISQWKPNYSAVEKKGSKVPRPQEFEISEWKPINKDDDNSMNKNILNNALLSTDGKSKEEDSSCELDVSLLPTELLREVDINAKLDVSMLPTELLREVDINANTPDESELAKDDASDIQVVSAILNDIIDSFQVDESFSSSATPDVTVIYNEPENNKTPKSNKNLKNVNANSDSRSVDSDPSYKNLLNEGFQENLDQVVSSSKFKEEGPLRSVSNNLWGDIQQDVNQLSENSENSDYGSNSSSSDETRIADVHNSVNRFVNNDISDQTEKKRNNKLNEVSLDLNTLKERILVNSLDKVLNQPREETCFHMIENNLSDDRKSDSPGELSDQENRPESKFWSQWIKGDSWDDSKEKKAPEAPEALPPRQKNADSPSKQKNSATNIRLVNYIKNTNTEQKNKNCDSEYYKFKSFPAEDFAFGTLKNVNVTFPKKSNDSEEVDRMRASCSWSFAESSDVSSEPKPRRIKKTEDTSEFVDELVQRWKNIAKEESPPDYDKILKWSPVESIELEWSDDKKPQRSCLIPEHMQRNKSTNTGIDDTEFVQYKTATCREINDSSSPSKTPIIESKMRCDKSTMTEGSNYTMKAKPIKEDLLNMFSKGMADCILDLYDKCNGNMDWIIEILLEDGYSPNDDQLEYLSSLQNVDYDPFEKEDKDVLPEKKKTKSGNGKNVRRNNSNFEDAKEHTDVNKKAKRKRVENEAPFKQKSFESDETEDGSNGELNEVQENEDCMELFLDSNTVEQLVAQFGNPTVYSLKDYQPVINLPVQLARQIHAFLLESVIDQAEKNESLINQLAEEELVMNQSLTPENVEDLTQNDMIEIEKSLSDVIETKDNITPSACEESFASKLSLDLLLKSFPTVDPSFVTNTFKSNNFNYYETKIILSQYRTEVPTTLSFSSGDHFADHLKSNEIELFENTTASRTDILDQVTKFRDEAAANHEQWKKLNEKFKTAIQRKRFCVASYYREIMEAYKMKHDECNANAAAVLINACCFKNSNVIDLHFFKVSEALKALDIFLDYHIARLRSSGKPKSVLYVITGRGSNNQDGVSHLQPPIKSRLKRRNVEFDVQPSNTGLVVVVVRKVSVMTNDL